MNLEAKPSAEAQEKATGMEPVINPDSHADGHSPVDSAAGVSQPTDGGPERGHAVNSFLPGKGGSDSKDRQPRPLKVRAQAHIDQLADIDDETEEGVAMSRGKRAAEVRIEIEDAKADIRTKAEGTKGVIRKGHARDLRVLIKLDEELETLLGDLENGRLAVTDDDEAILNA